MDVLNFSDVRQNLKEVMDRVVSDLTQVIVTRRKAEPVVMVALSEWNAISETMHLLSSEKNATRLLSAIRQLDGAGGTERALIDDEELAPA